MSRNRLITMSPTDHIIAQGAHGESALNAWLQKWQLSYVAICQSPGTFSTLFPQHVKRPDFLLLIPSLGTIAVDAKNYTLSGGVYTLTLETELRRSVAFERLFRMPLWYAYMDHEADGERWFWISALQAVEVGTVRKNSHSGDAFLSIPLSEFVQVETSADLAKLYSQHLPGAAHIAALPLTL